MNRGTYRLLALGTRSGRRAARRHRRGRRGPQGRRHRRPEGGAERVPCVAGRARHGHSLEPTKQPARILKWLTPADGVDESLFTVTRDGQPVAYSGPTAKRPAATDSDYLAARAAARASATSSTSATSTTSRGPAATRSPTTSRPTISSTRRARPPSAKDALASDTISVKAAGRAAKGKPPPPPPPWPGQARLQGVLGHTAVGAQRRPHAGEGIRRERGDLPGANKQGPRYTTWFGAVDVRALQHRHLALHGDLRRDAGRGDHLRLQQQAERLRLRLPNEPYKIYLGSVYWSAPAIGTDSQAGTLIHEMSHFAVVAEHR